MARTVLLAGPLPMWRAGLKSILASRGFTVVAEASDIASAVAGVAQHRPAVCIVDAELPGGWLVTIHRITRRVPETAVVVCMPATFDDCVVDAVLAGANGLLRANATDVGLIRTMEAVLAGEVALPRGAVTRLADELRGGGRHRTAIPGSTLMLTERESQVLVLRREGLTTKRIAAELGLSPVTVRRHLGSIANKAGPVGLKLLRRSA